MLSAAEIAAARTDLAALLWERCTIRRRQPNGSWTTLGTDVPCRLTLSGAAVDGEQTIVSSDPRANATLTLPAGTNVGDEAALGEDNLRIEVGVRRFIARLVAPRQAFLMRILGEVQG